MTQQKPNKVVLEYNIRELRGLHTRGVQNRRDGHEKPTQNPMEYRWRMLIALSIEDSFLEFGAHRGESGPPRYVSLTDSLQAVMSILVHTWLESSKVSSFPCLLVVKQKSFPVALLF